MAHKQACRRPKATTTSYWTFKFEEAEDMYEKFISKRSFYLEKGILLQETPIMGYDEFIHSVITNHKWRQFCSHPTATVVPIIREFYAHLTEEWQKTVYVRGVKVSIDKDTINKY